MGTQPKEFHDNIDLHDISTGSPVPGAESSGQHVLLLLDGKPVVLEPPSGDSIQVLTTSGMVSLPGGAELGEYFSATPEEVERLETLVSQIFSDEYEEGGGGLRLFPEMPAYQSLSVVTPQGGALVIHSDMLVTIPVLDLSSSGDTVTLDDVLPFLDRLKAYYGPKRFGPDDDPQHDDPENETPVDPTLLDLSWASEALRIDLSTGEYVPMAGGDAKPIAKAVTKVIGAADYDNVIIGDDRDNELTGGEHSDRILGMGGNDTIYMNTFLDSSDTIDGGDGNDTLSFTQNDANPTDALNGVTNVEYVLLGDADTSLTVTDAIMTDASQSMTIDARAIKSGGNLVFDGSAESQGGFSVYGTGEGDDITGGAGDDSLNGGAGDDTLDGGAGDDNLDGGAGDDTLDGGAGDDNLDGGAGDDTLIGGAGADSLDGGTGDDILEGGDGDDTLEGGTGADTLSGGGGNNTLSYASSGAGVNVSLESDSASGGDAEGDTVVNWGGFQNLAGSSSGDTLEGRDGEANNIEGGGGNDLLKHTSGGDTLDGGAGSDTFHFDASPVSGTVIKGGDGTDVLRAGNSIDYSTATLSGVEEIYIGDGHYARFGSSQLDSGWTVNGTTGGQGLLVQADSATTDLSGLAFDTWTAGEDVVSIIGTANDETIIGSAEDDSITSGGGTDSIDGGAGNDTILLSSTSGSSTSIDGGEGTDVLAVSGTVDLRQAASINNIETIALTGSTELSLSITDVVGDWAMTGVTSDTINLLGTASGDESDLGDLDLTGFDGALKYSGGDGNDTIHMGTNLDSSVYVDGGDGDDTLTFTYNGDTGALRNVTNVEYIELGDVATTLTLTNDTLVASGKTVTIDGSGMTHSLRFDGSTESDSLHIIGGSGDDFIAAGKGVNSLDGGAGNDTFHFDASPVSGTVIKGGEGRDALESSTSINYSAATISGVEDVLIGDGHYARFGNSQIESGWTIHGTTGEQEFLIQMDSATADLSGLSFDTWTSGEDVVSIIGTANDETITGSSADDSITSGGGTDSIDGGAGNDTILLSSTSGSSTSIDGGEGTDVLAVSGTVDLRQAASINNIETISLTGSTELSLSITDVVGDWAMTGDASDTINLLGTASGDESDLGDLDLTGFDGALKYSGGDGNDTIHMGTNLDSSVYVDGGDGDDTLTFTYNGDTGALRNVTNVEYVLLGDADTSLTVTDAIMTDASQSMTIDARGIVSGGNLVFDGSAESQGGFSVYGTGEGDDITGGAGDDSLNGGAGDDILDGGAGDDNLDGGAGNDSLDGGAGDDNLDGGAGDDTLIGGDGDDTLEGGAGADRLDGGGGSNTLSYASSGAGVNVSLESDSASGGDAEGDTVVNWGGFQNLAGSSSGDTLEGRDGEANNIEGGGGNDLLKYTSGGDTLNGGAGSDTFYFDASPVSGTVIKGGDGRDALEGGGSIDYSDAAISGVEDIFIGEGHNALFGSSQIESGWTVNGTTGEQEFLIQMDSATADLSGLSFETWTSGEDVVSIIGTANDETITGSSADDAITSGGGTDSINGGAGNDTISLTTAPGSGAAFDGGAGTDVLAVTASGDMDLRQVTSINNIETIAMDGGINLALATSQADGRAWSITGASSDTLVLVGTASGDESDLGDLDLTGFDGALKYSGGDGNDKVHMGTNLDSSVYVDGGDGDDTLTFTYNGDTGALRNVTNVEYVLLGDADTSLTVTDAIMTDASQSMTIDARGIVSGGNLVFDGSAESQGGFSVYGTGEGDDITGGAGDDSLNGGAGDDTLIGGAGDDNLRGGNGADSLTGGDGNDTLEGGAGADRLDGGGGSNTLSYASSGAGVNVSLESDSASGGDAEGDTVVNWGGFQNLAGSSSGDTLEGRDGEANNIEGGGGNDLLKYTSGGDTLNGGAGSDTFYFDASPVSGTVIKGGDGRDALEGGGSIDYSDAAISGVEDIFIGEGHNALFGSSQIESGWTVNGTTGEQEFLIQMDSATADLSGLSFDTWTSGEDVVSIIGTANDETITGSSADDAITSGGGTDSINGGAGNDTISLTTAPGDGTAIDGGAGTDVLAVTASGDMDLRQVTSINNIETIAMDGGINLVLSDSQADGRDWSITSASSDTLFLIGSALDDEVDFSDLKLNGFHGRLVVSVDNGDNKVHMGTNLDSSVYVGGGLGTDTLTFTYDGDTHALDHVSDVEYIELGDVATTLTLTNDTLVDSGETVTIDGSGMTHSLRFDGSTESDSLHIIGGSGDDFITAGKGVNSLDGGAGNDTFHFDAAPVSGTVIKGGEGRDALEGGSINYTAATISGVEDIFIGVNAAFGSSQIESGWTVNGTTGEQRFVIQMDSATADLSGIAFSAWTSGEDVALILGTANDETITGSSADDIITSGGGTDSINGGAGNDTISLTTTPGDGTAIDGGAGTDMLTASGTVDLHNAASINNIETIALSGAAALTLATTEAHEKSWAMTGDTSDTINLRGGASDEESDLSDLDLTEFKGEFRYSGGDGNDTLHMGTNLNHTIYVDGGAGTDTLTFTYNGDTGSLDHVTNMEYIKLNDAATTLTLNNNDLVASGRVGIIDGSGLTHDLWFDGRNETDNLRITGGTGNDTIFGGSDRDSIQGGDGNDSLVGGANIDTIRGGAGNDRLTDEGDSNRLYGDAGNDRLTATGRSNILYGGEGNDRIHVDGKHNIVYGGAGNDTITMTGDEGIKIYGGDGDDSILTSSRVLYNGGAGNDTFYGGMNASDRYYVYKSYSEVTEYTDTIKHFSPGVSEDHFWFDRDEFMPDHGGSDFIDPKYFFRGVDAVNVEHACFYQDIDDDMSSIGWVLWYDPDGTGSEDPSAVAIIDDGLHLTEVKFDIICIDTFD